MSNFIKIKDVIVAVSTIKNIIINNQMLIIETTEGELNVYFDSYADAKDELNNIYDQITKQ